MSCLTRDQIKSISLSKRRYGEITEKNVFYPAAVVLYAEIAVNMLATAQMLTPAQEGRRVRKDARHPSDHWRHPLCRRHDHKGCKQPATVTVALALGK